MKKQLYIVLGIVFITLGIIFIPRFLHSDKMFEVMKVPDFELTNQNKESVSNKDLLGKVYVVEFFFTNCPTICPIMNRNLKYIDNEINDPNFGIVSITIDPKRDSAEILHNYAERLGIKSKNWHFLTGNRDYIYSVSKKFNIYIGEDENSQEGLEHSGKIALVDKKGNIRSRYNEQGIPKLYYSALNYSDEKGKKAELNGKFRPDIELLKEDIKKLLAEN